jgi:hypothetical protein
MLRYARARRLLLAGLVLAAAGCASGGQSPPAATQSRDVIALDEIMAVEGRTTAAQLIERLRPGWLRGRGPVNARGDEAPIAVYVDGQKLVGGITQLSRYVATELQELRHLNAIDATQRYGTGHTSGAILITTRATR